MTMRSNDFRIARDARMKQLSDRTARLEKINPAEFGRDRFGLPAMQARDKLRLR
jgi:hypothetical protein